MSLAELSTLISQTLPGYATIIIILIVAYFFMSLIKRILVTYLTKLTNLSSFEFDSLLVKALKLPLSIVVFSLTTSLLSHLLNYYDYASAKLSTSLENISLALIIIAIILFFNRFFAYVVNSYASKSKLVNNSEAIIKSITTTLVFGLGILVLLSTFGISITPIIASLGISSLAIALALQPTLENFFSGVQLVVDKPIRVGDFIELESGEQGFVDKIGWRSTWIKMLPNNMIIIPNSQLSKSKVINYFYPTKELSVPVEVGVHYDSDLDHVERVTLEVAREILQAHKWGVPEYDTFVLFHTFDSSSINLTVMLRTREYFNRFFIKSAFIKALHKRYAEEGITIPYPIRAINTAQESAKLSTSPEG